MKSKLSILNLFFLFVIQNCIAQNLVPNPSFEDTIDCPTFTVMGSSLSSCSNWFNPLSYNSTPDYFNACASPPPIMSVGVPSNFAGYQLARTGNSYCGVILSHSGDPLLYPYFYSEYISVQIDFPLVIGQAYEIKMYLNLADLSEHSTNIIEVLLTGNIYSPPSISNTGISATPQLSNLIINYISDTVNWIEAKQTFLADSSYQFLTIGHFQNYSDSLINTGVISGQNYAYIYIDDVSLTPVVAIFDTICEGESLSLISQGNSLFSWANSFNPNVIISTDSILIVSPTINTTYYDYSNNNTVNHVVIVTNNRALNLGADTNLCLNETLILNANNSYSTYLWQDNSTDYKYEVTQAGTYWVQVTNSCGIYTDTIEVTYDTIPVNLGPDTTLCVGQTLTLNPNIPSASYQWQDFSSNSTFTIQPWINQPNTYWVQIKNSNGCGSDSIYVNYNVNTNQNILSNYATSCDGDSISLTASVPYSSYQWSTGSTDSIISVAQTGIYWVKATNNCYVISDTINVTFRPIPYFELGNDTTLCFGDTLILEVNTLPNTVVWWNNFTPNQVVVNEGLYYANANLHGCLYNDSIYIYYEDCDISLVIPNIITPNDDGFNDFFQLIGQNINSIDIKIFNRWGQLIFKSNDINTLWNGKTINNKDYSSGTYFYIIKAENEEQIEIFKGTITLIW